MTTRPAISPAQHEPELPGQTVITIGGSSGIGPETAGEHAPREPTSSSPAAGRHRGFLLSSPTDGHFLFDAVPAALMADVRPKQPTARAPVGIARRFGDQEPSDQYTWPCGPAGRSSGRGAAGRPGDQ